MARIEKKTKRYPSDLTDEEWAAMEPFLPKPYRTGSRRRTDLREALNAIRYMVRSGCEWRMLPVHFPPWQTVYWWFRRFVRLLMFCTASRWRHARLRRLPEKIVGRKRHIAVDVEGRLLMVGITTADISDSAGAQAILDALRERRPLVKHLFADGAYDRLQLMDKAAFLAFTLEIVRRTDAGFKILPRRWVVERTFGWLTRYRRLVRDCEARIDVSQAFIYVAMTNMLVIDAALTLKLSNGL